jgi:competence protein ComEC
VINFKSIPFLKILIPYVVGIIFLLQLGTFNHQHAVFLTTILLFILTFFLQKHYKLQRPFLKWCFIVSANLLLFFSAFESGYFHNSKSTSYHYTNYYNSETQSIIATIDEVPVITKKYVKLFVQINCIKKNNNWHYCEGKTIVYIRNDSSLKYTFGKSILINSKLSAVSDPKNPNEFNYNAFLKNKNIFHIIYTENKNTHVLTTLPNQNTIKGFATKIKSHVISTLRNSGLSQPAFSICSALLVGYDDEIDNEVMQSFSHAGALHVLSVSGMHTGILYGALIFLFSLFDKYNNNKKIKFVFIAGVLIVFTFITGLSPSVLRATIMLLLLLLGSTFFKKGNPYNTLFVSFFILLLINPYLLIDVGFLLSYSAVFGIMYLYPILNNLYLFEHKLLNWFWSSVLISISATIFTLPISLYFFHQFPIWFVLSNLIVVPLCIMLMGLSFLLLLFGNLVVINGALAYLINNTTAAILWLTNLTNNPKIGFIDFIHFTAIDVFFLIATITITLLVIVYKQYKHVISLGLNIIAWITVSIYTNQNDTNKNELVVFHVKQKPGFVIRVGTTAYTILNQLSEQEFQRSVKPYLLTISNLKIKPLQLSAAKLLNCAITHNTNYSNANLNDASINYIIISNDYDISLTTSHKTKLIVIADCSNSYNFVNRLKKKCLRLGITFFSVKENGAFKINL